MKDDERETYRDSRYAELLEHGDDESLAEEFRMPREKEVADCKHVFHGTSRGPVDGQSPCIYCGTVFEDVIRGRP